MTLGEKIQNFRKEKEMTQTEFAERFGVSRQAVSKWELDQMMPELPKLIELADDFDISLDELVRDKEKTKSGEGQKQQADEYSAKSGRLSIFKGLLAGMMGIWLLYGSIPEHRWEIVNLIDINFLLLVMAAAAVTAVLKLVFYQKYEFIELYRYIVILAGVILSAIMLMTHMKYGLLEFKISILPFFYSLVLELAASIQLSLPKCGQQGLMKLKKKQIL